MKRPRRLVVLAALCGTVALAAWVEAGLAGLGLLGIETARAPIEDSRATSGTARAEHVDAPRATALGEHGVSIADIASGSAALSDPPPMPQSAAPPVLFAAVSPTDPVQNAARPVISSEALDACPEPEVCIDQYLWSLYERTPKVDTVKVEERIKVKVKNKGKTRTVVKTLTKYVTEDFGWKDPKAAQKVGMSLQDYVIGGMDRGFRRTLYNALRAMDDAGLSPGITSAFRDDYRQELASGDKAASDSSYHGGSRRGGYGHGLAADLVSVKGETRAERCTWSEILWKWIDAHEKELGIGRPYLDKDPPHVAPIDGKEYAEKRSAAKAHLAGPHVAPIDGKEHADKRSAAKARLAGLKKPSPSSSQK
ncbi:MAG: peptidase M15 [Xanthobacteraceae bacterium]